MESNLLPVNCLTSMLNRLHSNPLMLKLAWIQLSSHCHVKLAPSRFYIQRLSSPPPPFICKRPWKSWKSRNRSWANFLQSLSIPLICYSGLNTEGIEAVLCLYCNRNIILDRLCLLFETNKKRCIFCNCLSKILSSLRETQSALAKFWDDFCTCFAIFYFCLNSVIHCSIQT